MKALKLVPFTLLVIQCFLIGWCVYSIMNGGNVVVLVSCIAMNIAFGVINIHTLVSY